MQKRKQRLPIVKLYWVDAHVHSDGWLGQEEFRDWLKEPGVMVSVGTLIERSKRWVVLAQSVGPDSVADLIKVPAGMVLKVVRVGWLEPQDMDPTTPRGRRQGCPKKSTRRSSASTS